MHLCVHSYLVFVCIKTYSVIQSDSIAITCVVSMLTNHVWYYMYQIHCITQHCYVKLFTQQTISEFTKYYK